MSDDFVSKFASLMRARDFRPGAHPLVKSCQFQLPCHHRSKDSEQILTAVTVGRFGMDYFCPPQVPVQVVKQ